MSTVRIMRVAAWASLVDGAAANGATVEENALKKLDQWFAPTTP